MPRWLVGFVGVSVCLTLTPLQAQERKFQVVKVDGVSVAKEAHSLYLLDEKLKAAFAKKLPGVLPELSRKLPKPTAKSFDWSKLGVAGPVYTQGMTPYCWAFSAIEALECSWRIRNKGNPVLAVQPIIDHSKEKGGAPTPVALRSLLLNGTAPLSKYPYTGRPGTGPKKAPPLTYRAVAYGYVEPGAKVPSTELLKEALLKHGPLIVNVHVSPSFKKYKGGILATNELPEEGKSATNHSVLLVGWDDKRSAWRIKNSWDLKWGEKGYMWIKYGSHNIGLGAVWVRAQSIHYLLPKDAHESAGDNATAFHRWPSAKTVDLTNP